MNKQAKTWEETVMSPEERIKFDKRFTTGSVNLRGLAEAQAKLTWEARQKEVDEAEQRGIQKVVDIVRDWETIPSVEFNEKYKVKLIDDTEDETLLKIIERYLGIGKPF